nr:hypothetical protein [Tanacetum cinerariifolium]
MVNEAVNNGNTLMVDGDEGSILEDTADVNTVTSKQSKQIRNLWFHHERGMNYVVESGPWMVNNKSLVVQRSDINMSIDKTEPDKLPLWVKYEWTPPLCSDCGMFRHCKEKRPKTPKDSIASDTENDGTTNAKESTDDGFTKVKNKRFEKYNVVKKQNYKPNTQSKKNVLNGGGENNQNGEKKKASSNGLSQSNKFPVLDEYGEGELRKMEGMINRDQFDVFISMRKLPTSEEMSGWNHDMICYFKKRWESQIDKNFNVQRQNEGNKNSSEEMDDFYNVSVNMNNSPEFNYHFGCMDLKITHICFVNDLLMSCHGDACSASLIKKSLEKIGNCCGLLPNFNKSTIFFGNMSQEDQRCILNILPFTNGQFPMKYLVKEIIKVLKDFLWSNGEVSSARMAWKIMCKSKVWIPCGSNQKWISIVKLKEMSVWVVQKEVSDSWGWKNLLDVKNLVLNHFKYDVDNGRKPFMWYDNWSNLGPLINCLTNRSLYDARLQKSCSAADLMGNNSWSLAEEDFPFIGNSIVPFIIPNRDDKITWLDNNGN